MQQEPALGENNVGMHDDSKASVIAGLAIGIGFVMLFSIFFASNLPFYPISDIKLQQNMEQTREVKALLSKYPDASVQFYHGSDGKRTIDYRAFADIFPQGRGYGHVSYLLTLNIEVHPITGQVIDMALTCSMADGVNDSIETTFVENIEEEILKGECLDMNAGKAVHKTIYNNTQIPDLHMIVRSTGKVYAGEEGSYYWDGVCADMIG